jgi:hypothetical protein
MIEKFIKFLQDNDCEKEYRENFTESEWNAGTVEEFLKDSDPEDYFMNAFTWDETVQEGGYWSNLDTDWCNIVNGEESDIEEDDDSE